MADQLSKTNHFLLALEQSLEENSVSVGNNPLVVYLGWKEVGTAWGRPAVKALTYLRSSTPDFIDIASQVWEDRVVQLTLHIQESPLGIHREDLTTFRQVVRGDDDNRRIASHLGGVLSNLRPSFAPNFIQYVFHEVAAAKVVTTIAELLWKGLTKANEAASSAKKIVGNVTERFSDKDIKLDFEHPVWSEDRTTLTSPLKVTSQNLTKAERQGLINLLEKVINEERERQQPDPKNPDLPTPNPVDAEVDHKQAFFIGLEIPATFSAKKQNFLVTFVKDVAEGAKKAVVDFMTEALTELFDEVDVTFETSAKLGIKLKPGGSAAGKYLAERAYAQTKINDDLLKARDDKLLDAKETWDISERVLSIGE